MKTSRALSLTVIGALAAGVLPLLASTSAQADTVTQYGFENFAPGSPNGQLGWQVSNPGFDYSIVDPSATWGGTFGNRALRVSNAVASGSFGDQLYSASTVDEAGEASAQNNGLSGGVRQERFTASYLFGSATPAAYQAGLVTGISPDRGDGARMGLVRMYDRPAGLEVTVWRVDPTTTAFTEVTVASGLDRTRAHRLVMVEDLVDGEDNDVFTVSVDDQTPVAGTSWEEYFRDAEGNPSRTVDSLLFRSSGTPVPALLGNGFLIDNVVLTTSETPDVSDTTVVWDQEALDNAEFVSVNDTFPGASSASARFVRGPGTAPLGVGSYELSTGPVSGANNGKRYVGKVITAGALSSLTDLSYDSWTSPANTGTGQPYLNVTYTSSAPGASYGNLVYDPTDPANGVQSNGVWRTQNAFSPSAIWWSTRALPGIPQGARATWADLMSAMPDAAFHPAVGGIYLVVGSTGVSAQWTNFVGAVDALTLGIDGATTTYDFDNWEQCPSTTDIPSKTVTLTADCTTTRTLTLADGWTLDGAGYTITALDPSPTTDFAGAVLINELVPGGARMDVTDVTIDGNLADGCTNTLWGVKFDGAAGSLTNSAISDIRYGAGSGCQGGNSVDITNLGGPTRLSVKVDDVQITGFQKTGIRANGNVALRLTGSSVADAELDLVTASNSLQISRGARAYVSGNTFGGNDWDGNDQWNATGVLLYGAEDVTFTRNVVSGSDTDVGLYVASDPSYPAGRTTLTCNLFERDAALDTPFDLWNTGVSADEDLLAIVDAEGNTVRGFATPYENVVNELGGPCASGPVDNLVLDGDATSLTATWDAPLALDFAPVTSYTVTLTPGGATQTVTGPTATFVGLSPAKEYTVTVVPVNEAGTGTPSSASATTGPGDAVITSTATTVTTATVSWTVPGTAYTAFTVTIEDADGDPVATKTTAGDARSWTFTGLDGDTDYTLTVTPKIGGTSGGAATADVTTNIASVPPAAAPGPVTALSLAGTATSLTATWTAAPGATTYEATLIPGGEVQTVSGTSASFTIVAGKEFTVTVVAGNAAGWSLGRSASIDTTLPDKPTGLSVSGFVTKGSLTWVPPTPPSPVTSYTIVATPTSGTPVTTVVSAVGLTFPVIVGGLTRNMTYTFSVRATNAFGTGLAVTQKMKGTVTVLKVTPKSLSYGQRITLTGKVTDSDTGKAVAGQLIHLYTKTKGSTVYVDRGPKATTAANGTFTFTYTAVASRRYFVTSRGPGRMSASSKSTYVSMKGTATMALNRASVPVGTTVKFSGAVRPKTFSTVELQRKQGSTWVTKKTVLPSSTGAYSMTWKPVSKTDYSWRVRVSGPAFSAGVSASKILRVT